MAVANKSNRSAYSLPGECRLDLIAEAISSNTLLCLQSYQLWEPQRVHLAAVLKPHLFLFREVGRQSELALSRKDTYIAQEYPTNLVVSSRWNSSKPVERLHLDN